TDVISTILMVLSWQSRVIARSLKLVFNGIRQLGLCPFETKTKIKRSCGSNSTPSINPASLLNQSCSSPSH
ncbi:Hypothetical predicted protein, partial [Olea europaea subsp. europaea]